MQYELTGILKSFRPPWVLQRQTSSGGGGVGRFEAGMGRRGCLATVEYLSAGHGQELGVGYSAQPTARDQEVARGSSKIPNRQPFSPIVAVPPIVGCDDDRQPHPNTPSHHLGKIL